jgi:hypothetical protein
VGLALTIAALGSLQYAWNLHGMLVDDTVQRGVIERARLFWLDATKSDWRESLVGGVPVSRIAERFAMYWFDLRQQFGTPGVALAIVGFVRLLSSNRPAGAMLLVNYLGAAVFAFGYNVGDAHVFFLTSHAMVALMMAPGVAFLSARSTWRAIGGPAARAVPVAASVAFLAYPLVRIADTYPAIDRSEDRRPTELLDALTSGLAVERVILGTHLDWQTQNGLSYYARYVRPEIAWFRVVDVLPHFPSLIRNNLEIERAIALTPEAVKQIEGAFGDLFEIESDMAVPAAPLGDRLAGVRDGDVYVLCVIEPSAEWPLDPVLLDRTSFRLGGTAVPTGRYRLMAGVAGQAPIVRLASNRPFRERFETAGLSIDVRIESWIPFDTIRRQGYGQVIVGRHKVLTLERGLSAVGLTSDGRVKTVAYEAGLYAPPRRYLIRPQTRVRREME